MREVVGAFLFRTTALPGASGTTSDTSIFTRLAEESQFLMGMVER